jgi:hypothetical protein
MQTKQGAVLESLRAVDLFLDENADRLGDVVNTGARRTLRDALAEIDTHATDQTASSLSAQGATKQKRMLERRLRRWHMRPIARIARSDLPTTAAVEPLKMPKGRPTAARLAALADGMAQAAAPFADTFIAAGLRPDFIARLHTASSELLAAVTDRTQNRGQQGGATTGLKQQLSSARKLVHVLDAFVEAALADDDSLLASWNLIKRVRHIAPNSKAAAPKIASTPAPAVQSATPATTAIS